MMGIGKRPTDATAQPHPGSCTEPFAANRAGRAVETRFLRQDDMVAQYVHRRSRRWGGPRAACAEPEPVNAVETARVVLY